MPEGILNIIEPDACCSPRFSKAARGGALDRAESWTCPKCGIEYKPEMVNGAVRNWVAHVYFELMRAPQL